MCEKWHVADRLASLDWKGGVVCGRGSVVTRSPARHLWYRDTLYGRYSLIDIGICLEDCVVVGKSHFLVVNDRVLQPHSVAEVSELVPFACRLGKKTWQEWMTFKFQTSWWRGRKGGRVGSSRA